ncbi:MAG: cytochrome b/b6 domain-containing protein [Pseudomonadota bacterium]
MSYSTPQVLYHWLTAALLVVMAGTGLAYSYELADAGAMRVHQIAGQGLIVVLVLRLATRLIRGAPPGSSAHAGWERRLAHLVHIGLYATLFAFVVTGYVSASAESRNALLAPVGLAFARSDTGELLLEIHYLLKWVLLAFFALHLGGALKHHFIDRDGTLSRMSLSRK